MILDITFRDTRMITYTYSGCPMGENFLSRK